MLLCLNWVQSTLLSSYNIIMEYQVLLHQVLLHRTLLQPLPHECTLTLCLAEEPLVGFGSSQVSESQKPLDRIHYNTRVGHGLALEAEVSPSQRCKRCWARRLIHAQLLVDSAHCIVRQLRTHIAEHAHECICGVQRLAKRQHVIQNLGRRSAARLRFPTSRDGMRN
jgi:hypothetical protein